MKLVDEDEGIFRKFVAMAAVVGTVWLLVAVSMIALCGSVIYFLLYLLKANGVRGL